MKMRIAENQEFRVSFCREDGKALRFLTLLDIGEKMEVKLLANETNK